MDLFFLNISAKLDSSCENIIATIVQVGMCYLLFFLYIATYIGLAVFTIRMIAICVFAVYIFSFLIMLCRNCNSIYAQKNIDIVNTVIAMMYYTIEIIVHSIQ